MVDDLVRGCAAPALTEELVHFLMGELAALRPLFHSEADFQHSFAARLAARRSDLEIRLEIPYRAISSADPALHGIVDMHCRNRDGTAATTVEFKYRKRRWRGTADGESFDLLDQSAQDLGRHAVVHDIHRLEQWQAAAGGSAFAVILSNDPSFWEEPVRPPTGRTLKYLVIPVHNAPTPAPAVPPHR